MNISLAKYILLAIVYIMLNKVDKFSCDIEAQVVNQSYIKFSLENKVFAMPLKYQRGMNIINRTEVTICFKKSDPFEYFVVDEYIYALACVIAFLIVLCLQCFIAAISDWWDYHGNGVVFMLFQSWNNIGPSKVKKQKQSCIPVVLCEVEAPSIMIGKPDIGSYTIVVLNPM